MVNLFFMKLFAGKKYRSDCVFDNTNNGASYYKRRDNSSEAAVKSWHSNQRTTVHIFMDLYIKVDIS